MSTRHDGGLDPLLGLTNRRVRQPDQVEPFLRPTNMRLDPDRARLRSHHCYRDRLCEHRLLYGAA